MIFKEIRTSVFEFYCATFEEFHEMIQSLMTLTTIVSYHYYNGKNIGYLKIKSDDVHLLKGLGHEVNSTTK